MSVFLTGFRLILAVFIRNHLTVLVRRSILMDVM